MTNYLPAPLRVLLFALFFMMNSFDQPSGKRNYFYKTYLACQDKDLSRLSKRSFDSLIALPLCLKDTNGNPATLQSFEITYAERGLYEDSTGLPIIFTDYTYFKTEGNSISAEWKSFFKEHSYKGDTVYIDHVKALGTEGRSYPAQGLKIVIE